MTPALDPIDHECESHNAADAAYFAEKRRDRWRVLGWLIALGIVGLCGWIRGY